MAIVLSKYNPILFYPATTFKNVSGRFENTISNFTRLNPSKQYFQKWQQNDNTSVQFKSYFDTTNATIQLYSIDLKRVIFFNNFSISKVSEQKNIYRADIMFSNISEGYYFLCLNVNDLELVSEPFQYLKEHVHTTLLSVNNSENNAFHIFNDSPINYRIDGYLEDFSASSKEKSFTAMDGNKIVLSCILNKKVTLFVGNDFGVDIYVQHILSALLSIETIIINENTSYYKDSDNDIEINKIQGVNNIWFSLSLTEISQSKKISEWYYLLNTEGERLIDRQGNFLVSK